MLQLVQLEYAVKVAELGSITAAADQLFISQPALTKSIQNLESRYRVTLFNREPRGVSLTAEGKKFIYHAKGVLTSAAAMNKTFAVRTSPDKQILAVASQQFDFLSGVLQRCYADAGDSPLHFNIVECDRGQVISSVLEGDVELGLLVQSAADSVVFSKYAEEKKLEFHHLASSGVLLHCGPHSALYSEPGRALTQLQVQDETHLVLDMEADAIQSLYFGTEQHGLNLERLVFLNSIETARAFLLHTDACLYTPRWVTGMFAGLPIRTFEIDLGHTGSTPISRLYWIKRAWEPLSAAAQNFVHHLTAATNDQIRDPEEAPTAK